MRMSQRPYWLGSSLLLSLLVVVLLASPGWAGLILEGNTDGLEIVTSAAGSIDYQASWANVTATALTTPGATKGNIATATTTAVIGTPSASNWRHVRVLEVRNAHGSVTNTVTVQVDVSGTDRTLYRATLAPGEHFTLDSEGIWHLYDSSGIPKSGTAGGSGDSVTVDAAATINPNFDSSGDLDFILCTGAGAPDAVCLADQDVIARVQPNAIALTTDTTGNYVQSVATTAPLSGGAAGAEGSVLTLTTSMATNRLIGRTTAGTGVMEEITVNAPLTLGSGVLDITAIADGDLANNYSGVGDCGVGNFARTLNDNAAPTCAADDDTPDSLSELPSIATDRLVGRDTAGSGAPEELTVSGGLEFSGSGGIQRSALTGDVTASAGSNATTIGTDAVTTAKIANDQVTFAKIQNIATDRLLGRDTAATGDIEELTVSGGVEFSGSGGIQRSALTGDVTASAGSNSTTVANVPSSATVAIDGSEVTTGTVAVSRGGTGSAPGSDDQVLVSDSTSAATWRTVPNCTDTAGNHLNYTQASNTFSCGTSSSGGGGAPTGAEYIVSSADATLTAERVTTNSTSITWNTGTGGQIAAERAALTGDVTASANSNATTIANDAVTYAKLQNISATNRLLGRITAGAGDAEELTGTQATTLLDPFTTALKGLAPASGGGTTNFLRADGTWAAPPGGGGAPTDATYLTATANGTLSAEIAVGVADDTVIVANGTTWEAKTLPSCSNGTTSKLLYDTATNAFSCGTDQGGAGSGLDHPAVMSRVSLGF